MPNPTTTKKMSGLISTTSTIEITLATHKKGTKQFLEGFVQSHWKYSDPQTPRSSKFTQPPSFFLISQSSHHKQHNTTSNNKSSPWDPTQLHRLSPLLTQGTPKPDTSRLSLVLKQAEHQAHPVPQLMQKLKHFKTKHPYHSGNHPA